MTKTAREIAKAASYRRETMFVAYSDFSGAPLTGPCSTLDKALEVGARQHDGQTNALVVIELPDGSYREDEALHLARRRGTVRHDMRRLAPAK